MIYATILAGGVGSRMGGEKPSGQPEPFPPEGEEHLPK